MHAVIMIIGRGAQCGCVTRVILPAYGAGPYLPALVLERPVFVREMSDGLYSPLTYLTYKVRPQPLSLIRETHPPPVTV